ncbi:MAG: response regulator [Magnetococcus sp. XQGC-1]
MTRILLVEDDLQLQVVYQRILEGAGYAVQVIDSCGEALQRLEEDGVDLLITDLLLPGIDGIELIQLLHDMPFAPPVIAITGGTQQMAGSQLLAMAREIGVRHTLHKPFASTELLQAVEEVLGGTG